MCYQLSHECGKAPQAEWHHALCKSRYSLTHKGVTGKMTDMGEIVKKQPKPMETNKDKDAHKLF